MRRKILVEKQSKRSVMNEEALHWETLQKMLAHSQPLGYRPGGKRSRKIDAHVEWVRGMLDRGREVAGSYETGAVSPVSSMIFPGRAREVGC